VLKEGNQQDESNDMALERSIKKVGEVEEKSDQHRDASRVEFLRRLKLMSIIVVIRQFVWCNREKLG
jgi:hypothetical protein